MFQNILVPTDFSENANNALDYALKIISKTNAQLTVIHAYSVPIIDPNMPGDVMTTMLDEVQKESNNKLKKISEDILKKTNGKVQCKCLSIYGFVVEEIISTVDSEKIDLIIMGTKGSSGIKEILIGSNAASVIEDAPCPVLTIPSDTRPTELKNIVYATDMHEEDLHIIQDICDLAKSFGANVQLIHIHKHDINITDESAHINNLAEQIKYKLNYHPVQVKSIEDDNVIEGINHYINQTPTDLIVMATHKRSMFSRFFKRSLTKQMVYHTNTPLLAFHKN